jgi:hypothetical protein
MGYLDVRKGPDGAMTWSCRYRWTSRLAGAVIVSVVILIAGGGSEVSSARPSNVARSAASPVPAEYRSLYGQVSSHLDAFARAVAAMPTVVGVEARRPPVAGVELLAANGNRLSALLTSRNLQLVDLTLDRLKQLGVGGITLGIKVPMLLSSFSPDAARYADFYAKVADHIRARGMVVSVELGSLFCGTVFAPCANPFGGSYQRFVADTAAQARIVIKRVRPTYLTLFSEPDTEAKLTGVRTLNTPAGAARAVADILQRIGQRGRTRIGAGAPTWLPTAFARAIVSQHVDYLDTHIYPVGAQEGANASAIARIAWDAHKLLVADEVWLYKNPEFGSGGATEQDARQDLFSFWEPLDARFLMTVATWARKAGASYVSAFWSWQFFTYLTWTPTLDAETYPQLTTAFSQTLVPALADGATNVGRRWRPDLDPTP